MKRLIRWFTPPMMVGGAFYLWGWIGSPQVSLVFDGLECHSGNDSEAKQPDELILITSIGHTDRPMDDDSQRLMDVQCPSQLPYRIRVWNGIIRPWDKKMIQVLLAEKDSSVNPGELLLAAEARLDTDIPGRLSVSVSGLPLIDDDLSFLGQTKVRPTTHSAALEGKYERRGRRVHYEARLTWCSARRWNDPPMDCGTTGVPWTPD